MKFSKLLKSILKDLEIEIYRLFADKYVEIVVEDEKVKVREVKPYLELN